MRKIINMNETWTFACPNKNEIEVNIPHTWNATDGQDGGNDYFRGTCTYRKTFKEPVWDKTKEEIYLQFDGVSASTEVYVNVQISVNICKKKMCWKSRWTIV